MLGTGGVKGNGDAKERAFWDPTMRFGLVMLNQMDQQGKPKRLTYEPEGNTNNCCIRLDGSDRLFGEETFEGGVPFRRVGKTLPRDPGRWTEMEGDLGDDPSGMKREGKRSAWVYDPQKVQITQTVELVVGESGQLDTCLVRYKIDNQDTKKHHVGLRFLLDTYIGANDGVPFLIPGQDGLCNTKQDLRGPAVPQYIQAFEFDDSKDPGTIARLQLKVGGGVESPEQVTLGAYPDLRLAEPDAEVAQRLRKLGLRPDERCLQEQTKWDVPVFPIDTIEPGDSCVTMYWPVKTLGPGESREVGFEYGLGDVAASESGGKLGLTADGDRTPGGELTVTAYVANPGANQTVTLTLPNGFQVADGGGLTRPVPAAGGVSRMSPVTWKVKAGGAGEYTLKAESNGASQTKKIKIRQRTLFGGN